MDGWSSLVFMFENMGRHTWSVTMSYHIPCPVEVQTQGLGHDTQLVKGELEAVLGCRDPIVIRDL